MNQQTINRIREFTKDRDWDQFQLLGAFMKKIIIIMLCLLFGVLIIGCGKGEEEDMSLFSNEKIVGTDIKKEDITDFYYIKGIGFMLKMESICSFMRLGKEKVTMDLVQMQI